MLQSVTENVPDYLRLRWGVYKNRRYISLISKIPFSSEAEIDGKKLSLKPYDMITIVDNGRAAPAIKTEVPTAYVFWVSRRKDRFRKLIAEVRALDPAAAPECYDKLADKAGSLLKKGKIYQANKELAFGLEEELRFRRDLLAPEQMSVPRISQMPAFQGNLDKWPEKASEYKAASGEFLQGHNYFPNSWHGPDDLSARLRFAHDGSKLYIGIAVKDNKHHPNDACKIWFSSSAYKDWKSGKAAPDITWDLNTENGEGNSKKSLKWKTVTVPGGYVIEASVPFAKLNITPGKSIGFLLTIHDMDGDSGVLKKKKWARKQILHYPYQPNFAAWLDARNCGELNIK